MSTYSILDTMATEFRIFGRMLEEMLGGVKRTGWMNLVIVVTMASILSIFGTMTAFIIESQLFIDNLGSGLQISVYMKDSADLDSAIEAAREMPYIQSLEVVTKEKAWEEMKRNYEVPDIANPLPDTLHVLVSNQDYIDATAKQLAQLEGVEKVNYAQDILQKIKQAARWVSAVGFAVSVVLGALTMFIINNTMHLLIQARSREIEILRMMGVGNWYIRLPFLLQGAFYGFIGSLMAYPPLRFVEHYLSEVFRYFQVATTGGSETFVLVTMVVIGIFVGGGGSAIALHKYLRV